jgi:hypothetical protein
MKQPDAPGTGARTTRPAGSRGAVHPTEVAFLAAPQEADIMSFLLHAMTGWLLLAPARPSSTPPDPCALLTKAEAEAILGKSIPPPSKGGSGECHYGDPGGADEIVVYPMMLAFKSNEEFHAFVVKDTKEMNERMKENLKGTGATVKETAVEPVPQIGDAAYYVEPSLLVLRKGRVLSITAADKNQAVTVAGKVVPRLQ